MGTRADFYVGRGPEAEWIGSIAWDGYPSSVLQDLKIEVIESESDFRTSVSIMEVSRDDFTHPEKGWPWPWENSSTTDFAYAWDNGIWISAFGGPWLSVEEEKQADESEDYRDV